MAELKKELGLLGATDIGIGAIIGAGVFVLSGVAAGLAGPGVVIAFILAGIVALLSALSSAELASIITEAGGSYIYATRAFGAFWGFLVGWMAVFDYIVGASAVSIGFAAYLLYFVGLPPDQVFLIIIGTALPLVLMLVNMKGMKEATGANNVLVFMKVASLIIFIVVGALFIFGHHDYSRYSPLLPNGVSGLLSATAIIFFAFIGFNTVTTVSEEVRFPDRNVPKAILLSFAVSTVLYIGVSAVEVGLVDWHALGISSAPLETALQVATNNILILKYVSISALFATASVVMSSIMGGSRALFAMARERTIPHALSKVSKSGVPVAAVVLCGVVMSAVVVAAGGSLDWLASAFNFGTLMTFLFVNLAVIKFRVACPSRHRWFKVPFYPVTPILAIVSCGILVFYLNLNAILIAAVWVVIGVGFYTAHQRRVGGAAEKEAPAAPPTE